jgi:hypothetical protein
MIIAVPVQGSSAKTWSMVVYPRPTKRYATKVATDAWRKLDNDFFQHLGLGWCSSNASLVAGGRGANKLWRPDEPNRVCWWSATSWANLGQGRRTLALQQARSAQDASSLSPRSPPHYVMCARLGVMLGSPSGMTKVRRLANDWFAIDSRMPKEFSSRTTPRRIDRRVYGAHAKMMRHLSGRSHTASRRGRFLGLHAAVYG